MRLSISILTLFIYPLNCIAQNSTINKQGMKITISPLTGIGITHLQFDIAASESGGTPNILSELIWKKNLMFIYGVESSFLYKHISLSSSFVWGEGLSGIVTDTDYAGDNRTLPFFEGVYSSHTSSMKSLKIDLGYRMNINSTISLQPSCVVNLNWRKFMMLNSRKLNENDDNFEPGLRSYYKMYDPNYGAKLTVGFLVDKLLLKNYFGIGFMNMASYGDWNLREELKHPKSYTQTGKGWVTNIGGEVDFNLSASSDIFLNYGFHYQNLKNGIDRLNRSDETVLRTRLNGNLFFEHTLIIGVKFSL